MKGVRRAPVAGRGTRVVPEQRVAERRVSPLFAGRPGWTVSEHPSGMVIWRSPTGRHYLRAPLSGRAGARAGSIPSR
ncbi:MAG TPA: hypothetical protein VGH99_18450 [Pseudonocardia sp.]|jgi:hypothetical protein